eukprot:128760-Lingulodinium_polyedra.AAC.1
MSGATIVAYVRPSEDLACLRRRRKGTGGSRGHALQARSRAPAHGRAPLKPNGPTVECCTHRYKSNVQTHN